MDLGSLRLSDSAFIAELNPREKTFWRFVVTLVAGLVAGFFVALLAGAVALILLAAATGAVAGGLAAVRQGVAALLGAPDLRSSLALMLLATATNAPLAATFVGVAALIAGRRVLSYLTAAPRFRWRLLVLGLVLSFIVIGPLVAFGQILDPHASPPPMLSLARTLPGRIGYVVACFALLIPAAAAEEVVFRGWLLRQSAALTRNPVFLMALNGVLFSAVHGEFAPDAFLTRWLMGAGFVYMTLRLGGVELSTGAHAANNILIVLFMQPLTLKPTPSAGIGLESLLEDAFLFLSYVVMAEVVIRWPPLRRWSGADLAPPASAEAPS